MDILVSSNLERLLFELSGKDGALVAQYMSGLSSDGKYAVADAVRAEVLRDFAGGRCSEDDTLSTIKQTFDKHNYLIDTHTAVAYKVLLDYRVETGDNTPAVVVSTASPFKFCDNVLHALGQPSDLDEAGLIDLLAEVSGCAVPAPLSALRDKTPRFLDTVAVREMSASVREFLR